MTAKRILFRVEGNASVVDDFGGFDTVWRGVVGSKNFQKFGFS